MKGIEARQAVERDAGWTGPAGIGQAASLLKLLAHHGRLEIMCLLLEGDATVGEIEARLGLSQSAVSQQLMRLRAESLVVARREGRNIRYSLGRPEARVIVLAVRQAFSGPRP